jgi:hypothetical protein
VLTDIFLLVALALNNQINAMELTKMENVPDAKMDLLLIMEFVFNNRKLLYVLQISIKIVKAYVLKE